MQRLNVLKLGCYKILMKNPGLGINAVLNCFTSFAMTAVFLYHP
ncbi:hypothetical protein LLB_3736 [Legionella longbeachae D-4968]|nr:hypothetical protein LLB_3736 [Legionella longbeachae D-4968]